MYQIIPMIDMGPFETVEVISEIQIQNGRWIPAAARISDGQESQFSKRLLIVAILIGIGILFVRTAFAGRSKPHR